MDGNPKTGELPNGGIAGSQLLEWTSPEILLNDAFDAARCVYHVLVAVISIGAIHCSSISRALS